MLNGYVSPFSYIKITANPNNEMNESDRFPKTKSVASHTSYAQETASAEWVFPAETEIYSSQTTESKTASASMVEDDYEYEEYFGTESSEGSEPTEEGFDFLMQERD
jgi:hypothetical protein